MRKIPSIPPSSTRKGFIREPSLELEKSLKEGSRMNFLPHESAPPRPWRVKVEEGGIGRFRPIPPSSSERLSASLLWSLRRVSKKAQPRLAGLGIRPSPRQDHGG